MNETVSTVVPAILSTGLGMSEALSLISVYFQSPAIPSSLLMGVYYGLKFGLSVINGSWWEKHKNQKEVRKAEQIALAVQAVLKQELDKQKLTDEEKKDLQDRLNCLESSVAVNNKV